MQFSGFAQNRVLFTPKRVAMSASSDAGSGPSSSWLLRTCWKPDRSFRFQRTSIPARCRGRRPR